MLRTIQSLMDLFWDYFAANAAREDAKDYGNVIHANVFAGGNIDPSTLIILLVPPPELHLLLGPVNTLYNVLFNVWAPYEEWIKRLNIKREEYHGGSFNGIDSRKIWSCDNTNFNLFLRDIISKHISDVIRNLRYKMLPTVYSMPPFGENNIFFLL